MPVSSLFEVGFRILRRHALILLAIAVIVQLPGAILDAVAQQRLASSVSPLLVGLETDAPRLLTPTDEQANAIVGSLALVGAGMLVSMILGAIATVAYASVVSRDYHGTRSTLGAVLGLAFRRAFAAIAAAVLAALAVAAALVATIALAAGSVAALPSSGGQAGGIGVFLALVVAVAGAVVTVTLLVRLALVTIVVAMERVGPVTALRRSWHLTGDNSWRTLAVLLLLAFIIAILGSIIVQLLGIVTNAFSATSGTTGALDAFGAAAVSVLFAPVAVVVQSVLYFDLRVRRDAWDLPAVVMPGEPEP